MTHTIELVGWYTFLAAAIVVGSFVSKAFLRFVLDKGALGEQVMFADLLIESGTALYKLIAANRLTSVSSGLTLILVSSATEASGYAAFGYASISAVIGGYVIPTLMRRISLLTASSVAPATVKAVKSDPDLR